MKRHVQNTLYHLLPVVFWLLAIGGSIIPIFFPISFHLSPLTYLLPVAWVLGALFLITHIKRHSSSVEPSFIVAVMLGIASYWLPSVFLLVLPMWGYLYYQHLLELRSFLAVFIGFALVAVWMAVLYSFQIVDFQFQIAHNLYAWIPIGAILMAYFASTIVRQILRVR